MTINKFKQNFDLIYNNKRYENNIDNTIILFDSIDKLPMQLCLRSIYTR